MKRIVSERAARQVHESDMTGILTAGWAAWDPAHAMSGPGFCSIVYNDDLVIGRSSSAIAKGGESEALITQARPLGFHTNRWVPSNPPIPSSP